MFEVRVSVGPKGVISADLVVDSDEITIAQPFFDVLRPVIKILDGTAKNWSLRNPNLEISTKEVMQKSKS